LYLFERMRGAVVLNLLGRSYTERDA
jgi:hypothetical protein